VAFVIEKVGPATSVEAQQKDNASLIARDMGLASADSAKMLRYVDLMFATGRPNNAVFAEMQGLLAYGDSTGWADQFLVRDPSIGDVPVTAAGLDSLWVRRYDYDPATDLREMDMPMIVFYGAEDQIVPASENAPLMRRLLQGNENARVVVVPKTGHGLGQGSQMRSLSTPDGRYDTHYWKFYRVAPDYTAPNRAKATITGGCGCRGRRPRAFRARTVRATPSAAWTRWRWRWCTCRRDSSSSGPLAR